MSKRMIFAVSSAIAVAASIGIAFGYLHFSAITERTKICANDKVPDYVSAKQLFVAGEEAILLCYAGEQNYCAKAELVEKQILPIVECFRNATEKDMRLGIASKDALEQVSAQLDDYLARRRGETAYQFENDPDFYIPEEAEVVPVPNP